MAETIFILFGQAPSLLGIVLIFLIVYEQSNGNVLVATVATVTFVLMFGVVIYMLVKRTKGEL